MKTPDPEIPEDFPITKLPTGYACGASPLEQAFNMAAPSPEWALRLGKHRGKGRTKKKK